MRTLALLLLLVFSNLYSQQFRRIEIQADLGGILNTNGVAVADFDLDNDLDIFIVAEASSDGNNPNTWSRLLRNNNNGSFTDITFEAGFSQSFTHNPPVDTALDLGDKMAASWGDFNNDGYPDLYLSNATQSQLYKNNGNGTFSNITSDAGLVDHCGDCYFTGALWIDIDKNGYLDLYISDYSTNNDNLIYLNNGDESFSLISNTNLVGYANSLSAIPLYANDDHFEDIYVANDFDQKNFLLINQTNNQFTEEAIDYGVEDPFDGMGLATCDFNNNGLFDFIVTNIRENGFYVQTNQRNYSNQSASLEIKNTDWSWGVTLNDFNHDGFEDLYIANGFANSAKDKYFENILGATNNRTFKETSLTNEETHGTKSRSVVAFDFDNDGDLDIIVSNFDGQLLLYENTSVDHYFSENTKGNWLKIKLEGTVSNKNAIGSIAEMYVQDDIKQFRQHHGSGYLSQSIKPIHFGLNEAKTIDSVIIQWPTGIRKTYKNLPINSTVKIIEGNDNFVTQDNNTSKKSEGCTNPDSCNYDETATVNNGTCNFLTSGSISGNNITEVLSEETYSYAPSLGDVYEWNVVNGEIIEGQGTNTIIVKWHIASEGEISVINRDLECATEQIILDVTLNSPEFDGDFSIARLWNEALLDAIRNDYARPTVHARNLFHTSVAMYDAWAIHDNEARTYLIGNNINGFASNFSEFTSLEEKDESIRKTISYAAYRLLKHRFSNSPNSVETLERFDNLMQLLNYDFTFESIDYSNGNPAALGNYIANQIIQYGFQDGSNELNQYTNLFYQPINDPLVPATPGISGINNPNRWQPLSLEVFIDQAGNVIDENTPEFLSPEWGNTLPFALNESTLTNFQRDSNNYKVYHDPGAPPFLGTNGQEESDLYKWGFSLVSIWQSHLDPTDGTMWDISPRSIGNISLTDFPTSFSDYSSFYNTMDGGDIGTGYDLNPITNTPYEQQLVPRGDYARILAEFWADGPDSETPPGHWFVLLNYVNDHPDFQKKFRGEGEILDNIEWDVKSYFILGGTMHDAAVAAWGIKGWYDYIRPISAIRYMADLGQSSDTSLDNYNENGIPLIENYIEIVEDEDPLAGDSNEHVGKIKLYTWKGHDYIDNTETDQAGVDWILAENWWPYQRPSFITPPFAGYVSGHSTYSRAAAEALTLLTGTPYFPGGIGEFKAPKNKFLVFEEGPSIDVTLQWATYRDASDQCSLSRIWGGIHPPMDDIPGRLIGEKIGIDSFHFAETYFYSEEDEEIIENVTKIKLFPNPINTSEIITIIGLEEYSSFILFDIYGKHIPVESTYNEETNTASIKIQNLATGIYLLKNNNKTWKLIIQ